MKLLLNEEGFVGLPPLAEPLRRPKLATGAVNPAFASIVRVEEVELEYSDVAASRARSIEES